MRCGEDPPEFGGGGSLGPLHRPRPGAHVGSGADYPSPNRAPLRLESREDGGRRPPVQKPLPGGRVGRGGAGRGETGLGTRVGVETQEAGTLGAGGAGKGRVELGDGNGLIPWTAPCPPNPLPQGHAHCATRVLKAEVSGTRVLPLSSSPPSLLQ